MYMYPIKPLKMPMQADAINCNRYKHVAERIVLGNCPITCELNLALQA